MSTPDPSQHPDRMPETGIDNGQDLSTRTGRSVLPVLLGGVGVVVAIVLSVIGLSLNR